MPFTKVNFFLCIPFMAIFLPLIPVLIGSLLSLSCAFFKRLITQNSFIQIIFTVIMYVLIGALVFYLIGKLPDKIEIITQYTKFIESLQSFLKGLAKYTLYLRFSIFLLSNYHVGINFLYMALIIIVGLV